MADKKKVRFGLLPKLVLGVIIPILVAFAIIGGLVFYSWNLGEYRFTSIKDIGSESLKELSVTSTQESKSSLDRSGEKIIREKAIDVAAQMEIFIQSRPPKMKREDVLKDPWLKEIAVQKVGETGYTAVHDTNAINHFHVNPQIVGSDLHQLSEKFPAFWKILEASLKGPASGYYDWKDADGKIRPKYMYLAPVKGTDLIVAATTYIDEFSKPSKAIELKMKDIERRYVEEYENKIRIFYIVVLGVLLILLVRIIFYARSVIKPILYLAEVADKISMGELDTPVQVKARGEVAILAESIERMQTSVKAAIERLQKRREGKT
ncbi:MAG: HAMP domain-containing protein [Deltaproteobacteria bacterium]|nr:HAMP domain-containing protein [Deltaproteobacteria bacterium]MBM4323766.1 HAMP domain-containing protein [Deltaproteobacteria bacterium]MBM4347846.1 HAMP domain-containing protein [Deltaproteobacteria bacterium]